MSAFTIEVANRPGELARLCETLGAGGINLVISGLAQGAGGVVAFIADDEPAARGVLREAGIDYVERQSLTIRLANVPGAGAATFGALAEANVNIEVFLPVRIFDEQFYAVICPDDIQAATAVLGDQVVAD